jgi:hypothetical protein
MAVLLGEIGKVELRRTQVDDLITGKVAQSDVNTSRNRFSFDFETGMLISGDQVEIRTTDQSLLSFVAASGWRDNQQHRDGVFFLSVDQIGAVSLYQTFDEAIAGELTGRIALADPGRDIPVSVEVRNNNTRILGQVSSYELNTDRDVIDVTALSDEFKRNYSGLINGNGRITCFFDYERRANDSMFRGESAGAIEVPMYLNQLILRTKVGSEFFAKLTLVGAGAKPGGRTEDSNDEIWYEFDARISSVAMSFSAGEPIEATIDFVATGAINLRTRYVSDQRLFKLEANQEGDLEVEADATIL